MKKKYLLIIIGLLVISNSFSQKAYNKVFVLGNSLTQGFGTHGMASSDIDTDYFFKVKQAISEQNKPLEMTRFAGGYWERSTTSKMRKAFLRDSVATEINGREDLILIQLGDNINSKDKRETLFKDIKKLLRWFTKKCPDAEILWVYGWYGIDDNMPIIKKAISTSKGCQLVDISKYIRTKYKNKIGNTYRDKNGNISTIESRAVAGHPNDLGMSMIANEIISGLGLNGDTKKSDSTKSQ